MRIAQRGGLAAGAVIGVLVLAGCGTSNGSLLTQEAATQLNSELTQATRALNDYNCQVAYQAVSNFSDDVNQLNGVNATLVKMLSEGATRISALANQRCPSGVSSSTTTTATATSSSTTTTATATTTTSVSATTTSPVTTAPSDTSTGTGGAAPTTVSTPTVPTTPPVVSTVTPTPTTPDSGGAGLNDSGGAGTGDGTNGGTGVGGGNAQ